ncbi:unnamed protein product [marine sediment metagenome]|uniref:Uncharacterized protein n=1 Tax=marine sediment metagenome TaxID=412755 RepID=X1QJI6_9ZZZZ
MPAHGIHVKTVEDHPLDVIPTMDDAHIPPEIARDIEVASGIATHAGIPQAHHAKYTDAEADDRADAKVATHDGLASPHPAATAVGGKTLGLADGDVAVLPTAAENQVLKRGATGWEAGPVPAEIAVFKAEAEPAIAADSVAIWCDTTVGEERQWLIFGIDGTVEGNKKVEMG